MQRTRLIHLSCGEERGIEHEKVSPRKGRDPPDPLNKHALVLPTTVRFYEQSSADLKWVDALSRHWGRQMKETR